MAVLIKPSLNGNSLSMLSSTIYTNFPLINKNILLSWLSQNQKKVSNYKLGNMLLIGCGLGNRLLIGCGLGNRLLIGCGLGNRLLIGCGS